AGFPNRQTVLVDGQLWNAGGVPWYELAPQRLLLAESPETIFDALTSAELSSVQLDGAEELFTGFEWTAEIPEPLRSVLIDHVTATGTEPMKFRMRHGYGKPTA